MPRRAPLDIDDIKPITVRRVPELVRRLEDGEELREIASFVVGRVRCVFDHNGNAELTLHIPAQDKAKVIPMTNYPGVQLTLVALVPEGVVDAG